MDLRITIALLFILITGGHSLKCYSCKSVLNGVCDAKEETCGDGFSKCYTGTVTTSEGSTKTKSCSKADDTCLTINAETEKEKVSSRCCDTDLCNGADGVFKGSFLLLLCPLFIYSLFH
ncbi:three finger toxin MALT0066C-like [Triplophysa dalaica]|uniref:three finger toxin MALT0066C-like n=1 Tax=Triplophysa dalaica TaxID=1582913 RepID=UPI0024DF9179|nr:three finger toxin MALT0066C-like [Triplophysa dalaica]